MLYVVHVFQIYQYLNAVLGVSGCFHFESKFNKFLFLLFFQCGVFIFVVFWWLMKNKISTSLLWKVFFHHGIKKLIKRQLQHFYHNSHFVFYCISEEMSELQDTNRIVRHKFQLQYKLENRILRCENGLPYSNKSKIIYQFEYHLL